MRIIVTPRAGMKVRDPSNPAAGYLPEDGAVKEDSLAWRRLAAAGDVTISPEPAPAAEAAAAKKK